MPCWTNLQFLCGYSAPEGCNLVAKFSVHIALTSITFQLSKHQRISCRINANKCYNDYYLQPWHNVFIDLERTLLQRCCNVSVPVGSFLIYNNKATWKINGTHGKNLHNFFFFFFFAFCLKNITIIQVRRTIPIRLFLFFQVIHWMIIKSFCYVRV